MPSKRLWLTVSEVVVFGSRLKSECTKIAPPLPLSVVVLRKEQASKSAFPPPVMYAAPPPGVALPS